MPLQVEGGKTDVAPAIGRAHDYAGRSASFGQLEGSGAECACKQQKTMGKHDEIPLSFPYCAIIPSPPHYRRKLKAF
jgi:hypothetical protein